MKAHFRILPDNVCWPVDVAIRNNLTIARAPADIDDAPTDFDEEDFLFVEYFRREFRLMERNE